MRQKHLVSLLKDGNIIIPLEFYRRYKELNITLEEFIFLMYLRLLFCAFTHYHSIKFFKKCENNIFKFFCYFLFF